MAVLTTGYTYSDGDQVTSTRLNSAINSAVFDSNAVDNVTTQLSGGAIIVKDAGITAGKIASNAVTAAKLESATNGQLMIGNGSGFTKAALTAGSNISVTNGAGTISLAVTGLVSSTLNSNLAASSGVTQAGSLGGDVVFNTTNAPTVTLTAGTWLVMGSVSARTSDASDQVWAQFYNSTDGSAFGGGAAWNSNASLLVYREMSCLGVVTVASNKVIHFKVFRAGSSTLDVGNSGGPAGFIQALRLTT